MKLVAIIFIFSYFQNIFSAIEESESRNVGDHTNHSGTSGTSPGSREVEASPTFGDKTSIPLNTEDNSDCEGCLKLRSWTRKMQEFSSNMDLENCTQEEEIVELDEFVNGGEASPNNCTIKMPSPSGETPGCIKNERVEKVLEEIFVSISEVFGATRNKRAESAREGPFCEKLLVILEMIRDIMDDIDKADPCKKRSSGDCFRYSYLSILFIRKYLWGVEYCIDKYCSDGRAITVKHRIYKQNSVKGGAIRPIFFVGRVMLTLCRINVLRQYICGKNIPEAGRNVPSHGRIYNALADIEESVNSCIVSHFYEKDLLKLLSKGLKKVFSNINLGLKNIRKELPTNRRDLNPTLLTYSLSNISVIVTYVYESGGWEKFSYAFHSIEPSITESLSLITRMKDCVIKTKGRMSEQTYKDIKEEIDNIHVLMTELGDRIKNGGPPHRQLFSRRQV
jgi:hypothetical protein